MKKSTLEKMQQDSALSEIQRMAAGCLVETKKRNGHRDLPAASFSLRRHYANMQKSEADEYVEIVANEADDREWTG